MKQERVPSGEGRRAAIFVVAWVNQTAIRRSRPSAVKSAPPTIDANPPLPAEPFDLDGAIPV